MPSQQSFSNFSPPTSQRAMPKIQHHVDIKIADIVFSLSSDRAIEEIRLEKAYRHFISNEKPEIYIHASYGGIPNIPLRDEEKVFDSEITWRYYRRPNGENIFVLHPSADGPLPRRMAIFDTDLLKGEVFSRTPESSRSTDGFLPSPLGYPLFEILMICLLSKRRGLMVHACGVDDDGKGYLFAGNSTHGKTTMAKIWKDHANILNDDRIILRHRDGRFLMYGTPFHGEYSQVSPHGVPLEKIFFLAHAESNQAYSRNNVIASSSLLARSFPPLWDPEGMNYTLDFCSQLIAAIPCYELDFSPDHNIIDFIRCVN